MQDPGLQAIRERVIGPFVAAVRDFESEAALSHRGLIPVVGALDDLGHKFEDASLRRMVLHAGFPHAALNRKLQTHAIISCYAEIHKLLMADQSALGDPARMDASYEAYAAFYDITHRKREKWAEMAAFVAQFLPPETRKRGADIVDIACGSGLSAALYEPFVGHLIGVDLSPAMLALAERRGKYDELHCATADDFLDGTDRSFDVVGFYDTLQIYPDFRPLLDKALRRVRPGGLFVFSIHWTDLATECRFADGAVIRDREIALRHIDEAGGDILACGVIYPGQKTPNSPPYDMELAVVRKRAGA